MSCLPAGAEACARQLVALLRLRRGGNRRDPFGIASRCPVGTLSTVRPEVAVSSAEVAVAPPSSPVAVPSPGAAAGTAGPTRRAARLRVLRIEGLVQTARGGVDPPLAVDPRDPHPEPIADLMVPVRPRWRRIPPRMRRSSPR